MSGARANDTPDSVAMLLSKHLNEALAKTDLQFHAIEITIWRSAREKLSSAIALRGGGVSATTKEVTT